MSPVADTILEQLGGARVFAMAFDAARSVYGPNMIQLKIARGLRAKDRATHVIIRLEADDRYTLEVHRITRALGALTAYHEGVYADQLRPLIEADTGLRLSL